MATDSELKKLQREIERLEKEKERELTYTTSMNKRNQLMLQINQLREMKKSPTKLKSFGKTFSKGLKITGRTLWKGIQTASRNLNQNAPEYKEFARSMNPNVNYPNPLYQSPRKAKPRTKMKTKRKGKKSKRVQRKQIKRFPLKNQQMMWEVP